MHNLPNTRLSNMHGLKEVIWTQGSVKIRYRIDAQETLRVGEDGTKSGRQ